MTERSTQCQVQCIGLYRTLPKQVEFGNKLYQVYTKNLLPVNSAKVGCECKFWLCQQSDHELFSFANNAMKWLLIGGHEKKEGPHEEKWGAMRSNEEPSHILKWFESNHRSIRRRIIHEPPDATKRLLSSGLRFSDHAGLQLLRLKTETRLSNLITRCCSSNLNRPICASVWPITWPSLGHY